MQLTLIIIVTTVIIIDIIIIGVIVDIRCHLAMYHSGLVINSAAQRTLRQ